MEKDVTKSIVRKTRNTAAYLMYGIAIIIFIGAMALAFTGVGLPVSFVLIGAVYKIFVSAGHKLKGD